MIWTTINSVNDLPEEGKYVLARHNRGTWHDSDDQKNVNCVVVKLVKGLSKEDRQLMKEGKLPDPVEFGFKRSRMEHGEDEMNNNLVPYNWQTFGPDSFFGQSIFEWTPII